MTQSIREQAQRQILDYSYRLGDAESCRAVFGLADLPTICEIMLGMLRSDERDTVVYTLLFVQDVVQLGMVPTFTRRELTQFGFDALLRDLLYVPDQNVRHKAVHFIGKIGPGSKAGVLSEAFPLYLERYALDLPDLLFELFWLSFDARQRVWDYLYAMARSGEYLVRWAAVESASDRDDPQPWGDDTFPAARFERFYERLADDESEFVRAEAIHALARLRHRLASSPLAREEGRARKRAVQQLEPALTFAVLKFSLWNYLHASGQSDYDHALLDAFARYRQTHPIQPSVDLPAYARAFETWREREAAHDDGQP